MMASWTTEVSTSWTVMAEVTELEEEELETVEDIVKDKKICLVKQVSN